MPPAKLVVGAFVTMDGVMQAPGGPDEDRDGGFTHGGWSFHHWDDMMGPIITEQLQSADALLLGRKTYEIFAGHWPKVKGDPVGDKLNGMPKYVASRSLEKVAWNNTHLLDGDAARAVAKLKTRLDGQIHTQGSADLLQTLLKNDLVDEIRMWTFPIVLGTGKRLFGDGTVPAAFRLADARTSTTGVAIHKYQRSGRPKYGSFALDETAGT